MVDPHQKKHDKNSKRNVECRSNTQARTRSSSKNEYKKIKKVLHNQDLSSNLLVMFSQLHLVIYPKEFFINKTNGRKIGILSYFDFRLLHDTLVLGIPGISEHATNSTCYVVEKSH